MQNYLIPKGTRDIPPGTFAKRQFILDTIKHVFQKYGYKQMETPAMEYLSTLTDKYGEEGEQLIFKILDSGDFLKKVDRQKLVSESAGTLTPHIAQKGLRYDLTVPFARYVSMHRHDIAFPFKRFQMQPVWRADRPQKGRYREFYQCDADIVGTHSLLCEAEVIAIIREVCDLLHFPKYQIRVNHKAILAALAKTARVKNEELFFSILDKWHKMGSKNIEAELLEKCMDRATLDNIMGFFTLKGSNVEKIELLYTTLKSPESTRGLEEIKRIISFLPKLGLSSDAFKLDTTLARGLHYYTGAIFEVAIDHVDIGSVCGGGRYDNLIDAAGMPGIPGIGFSFGIDRLYDAMSALNLFPSKTTSPTMTLIASLDERSLYHSVAIASELRSKNCFTIVYPSDDKLKKQLNYAHKNSIPFVIIIGEDEIKSKQLTLKNMCSGKQEKHTLKEIISILQNNNLAQL